MTALQGPEWQTPFATGLTDGVGPLRAALLTTFEPPDPDLLVEDVLPRWLGLSREFVDSGQGRATFLVELQQRLKALRGQVSIFSSSGAIPQHWLWRDVHVCQVGSTGKAVQHAKLWVLHRGPQEEGGPATLEVVVSSTNLTRSALRGQIQAGWRAVIPFASASKSQLKSWGILPAFLQELGRQSGEVGRSAVDYWLEQVLPRVKCPDVKFLASVPGRHSGKALRRGQSAWGVAGLGQLHPVAPKRRIRLVAPSVGSFDQPALQAWAARAGSSIERLTLAWIHPGHPWGNGGWSMPSETATSIRDTGMPVVAFPEPGEAASSFHDEWDRTKDRWVHGKLYWLQDSSRRRLLVTSANWSQAAWGKPLKSAGLSIANFELGVAFDSDWAPLESAGDLDGDLAAEALTQPEAEATFAWYEGAWNGKVIALSVRLASQKRRLAPVVEVTSRGRAVKATVRWRPQSKGLHAKFPWPAAKGVPHAVLLRTAGSPSEKVQFTVTDTRARQATGLEEFVGLEPEDAARLERRLLEERYGGPSADDPPPDQGQPDPEDGPGAGDVSPDDEPESGRGAPDDDAASGIAADYEVPALAAAREKLGIVTKWAERLANGALDEDEALAVIEDGRRLLVLWRGQLEEDEHRADLATRLAAGELAARLKGLR